MTNPDTCSSAGGAISLWMKLVNCTSRHFGVVIRTGNFFYNPGFTISCSDFESFPGRVAL